MKIAIVSCFYSESTLALTKYLAKNNCEVHYYYITSRKRGNGAAFDYSKASKRLGLHKLDATNAPEIHNYFKGLPVKLSLIRVYSLSIEKSLIRLINKIPEKIGINAIRKEKYDVINFVGTSGFFDDYNEKLKEFKRFQTVHEVNDHTKGNQANETPLFSYLIKNNVPIITHSKISYDRMLNYPNVNKEIVFKVPFSLFETFNEFDDKNVDLGIPKNKKVILFFGIIKPYKGLDLLIKAYELIKDKLPGAVLVIAGKGKINNVEKIEKDNKYVVVNRELSNEEIVHLNKRAYISVCPYLSASQSGIVMTSFLYDTPIIATKVGAFEEVIIHGENGLLIEPSNPQLLADAIYKSITDEDLYNKMLKGVQEFTNIDDNNWDKIAQKAISIYKTASN